MRGFGAWATKDGRYVARGWAGAWRRSWPTSILAFVLVPLCLRYCRPAAKPDDLPAQQRIAAAETLTGIYEHSRFDAWHIQAFAISERCAVILVHVDNTINDDIAEKLYYGVGAYDVTPGGARRFANDHGFRGVIFEDHTEWRRAFGDARAQEAEHSAICGMATK